MKFKKKPVQIEAVKWTEENKMEMQDFLNTNPPKEGFGFDDKLWIGTLEGVMTADKGDWIIKGVKGEFYPCKPDIFEATYDKVDEPREAPQSG